jgi:ABC-2 type transport system permease protein
VNRGLIEKALREIAGLTAILGLAILCIEALIAWVLATFRDDISNVWGRIEFVKGLLEALLGSALGDAATSPLAFDALPWIHPLVLAMFWILQLTHCSRMPAGEIDRGTIDVLLGLPVSRRQVLVADTAVLLAAGILLVGLCAVGNWVGNSLAPSSAFPSGERLAMLIANGAALFVAVSGVLYLVASACDRRGRAVAWGLAICLGSFLASFVAQFWKPGRFLRYVSFLGYYEPARIIQNGAWPMTDIACLLALGITAWLLALSIFERRDISTT